MRPYMYIFDATGLTNGTSPDNLRLPIQADIFRFRRLIGLNTVAQKIRLYTDGGSLVQDTLAALAPVHEIVPEIVYRPSSQVRIDLGTVAKAASGGSEISYLVFQGVREDAYQVYVPKYQYRRLPYTIRFDLTIDWRRFVAGTTPERPRRVYVPVDSYDFELHTAAVVQTTGVAAQSSDWAVQLQDAYDVQLSNLPVPIAYMNTLNTTFAAAGLGQGVLYPQSSQIKLDITSWIDAADASFPKSYQVQLIGYRLIPQ